MINIYKWYKNNVENTTVNLGQTKEDVYIHDNTSSYNLTIKWSSQTLTQFAF